MHLGTVSMLEEIEFADAKTLKLFYNYNCSTNRMHHDFKLQVKEELHERRQDAKIIELQANIAKENSIATIKKKIANARVQKALQLEL